MIEIMRPKFCYSMGYGMALDRKPAKEQFDLQLTVKLYGNKIILRKYEVFVAQS